jgi:hypothetical protein
MHIPNEFAHRHTAVLEVFQFFSYDHLHEPLRSISGYFFRVAYDMISRLPDCAELTHGLRSLLEAKECFIRTAAGYGINPNDVYRARQQQEQYQESEATDPALAQTKIDLSEPESKED